MGWISTPALNYICKRLAVAPAEAYGVATFYSLFATTPRPPVVAHVCDDIACRLAGAESLCADLTRSVGPAGEPIRDGRATWLRSPCLGLCDRAPALLLTVAGERSGAAATGPVDAADIVRLLETDHAPRSDAAHGTPRSCLELRPVSSAGSASSIQVRSMTTVTTVAMPPWLVPWRSARPGSSPR